MKRDLFKDGFKGADFQFERLSSSERQDIATIANGILKKALKDAPSVFSSKNLEVFTVNHEPWDTHEAKLVYITTPKN